MACSSCSPADLSNKNDLLQKENIAKEREIRRLNKDLQNYEQTILDMRSEISHGFQSSEVSKKDAEVMVGMCCTGKGECGGLDGYGALLNDDSCKYTERLKGASEQIRALRKVNVALSEELHALRRVCAALDDQLRAASTRTAFKDDIIREMRRQLKQAKAKIKESDATILKPSLESVRLVRSSSRSYETQRSGPQRLRSPPPRDDPTSLHAEMDSDEGISPRLDGSGDDCILIKADSLVS